MKSIKPLSVITLVLLTALASAEAAVAVPAGRVNFNLTALEQMSDTVSLRTNKTSTGTNIVQTVTSKVNTKIAVNSDILKLLVNSITNLPATIVTNAHLATDGKGQFFVVTATTTNNVSSVLSYTTGPWVFSGAETIVTKTPPAADLLKKALGIPKGSGTPLQTKVGELHLNKWTASARLRLLRRRPESR